MNTFTIARIIFLILLIFSVIALINCGGPLKKIESLETAREAYASAETDPQVAKSSPVELKKASDTLKKADALWRDKGNKDEIDHYAYLAKKHVEIAYETAQLGLAEDKINDASKDRDLAVLQSRTQEAERAKAHAGKLAIQLAELHAKQTLRGIIVTLGDVLFDSNRARMRSGAIRSISSLVTYLKEQSNRNIMIEGFTDDVGSQYYNQNLSERRAYAVRDALVRQGVNPNRVSIRGYGESFPVTTNNTPEGRQRNRRVEIIISDENGNIPARTSS